MNIEIKRRVLSRYLLPAPACLVFAVVAALAQSAPSPTRETDEKSKPDEMVTLSPFQVSGVNDHGYGVSIASTLPIGRGMGSSASLAVAIVRAWSDLTEQPLDTFDAAMPLERLFHQNPSGVDVAVIARGGVLRYQRTVPPTMSSLPCPSWTAVVIPRVMST